MGTEPPPKTQTNAYLFHYKEIEST